MIRTPVLVPVLCSLLAAGVAAAQPAPPPPATDAAPAPLTEPPKLPEIDDPMLQAVPPAPRVLTSWRDALQLARAHASSLQIAEGQIDQSSGQARESLARALPTLTGTAGVTHNLLTGQGFVFGGPTGITRGTIPDPLTTWNANLGLNVPLFAPQAWHDTGTARRATRAAELGAKETERQVLASVAAAIVTVVTSERLAEVSRVALASALSTLDLTKGRARLGTATAVDVLRADQEVALARGQIVSANESVLRSREALGFAMGVSEPYGVSQSISLDSLAGDASASCRLVPSVDSRPDVRAAQANVEISERNVDSVDWQYLPTVNLVSNVTYQSLERVNPDNRHVAWSIGGVLTWQLYDGGLRYGQKEQTTGSLRIAREQLGQTRRQAQLEVIQAQRAVKVAEANLAVSTRSRDLASENSRLSRVMFMNGAGTSFDLVDAAKRLREAELDLAIKEFEVIRAKIAALLSLATCDV